jgi:hypothetical protein
MPVYAVDEHQNRTSVPVEPERLPARSIKRDAAQVASVAR